MKALEWTTIDRKAAQWPSGPWDEEPDKVQWQDEATGLPCLAVRHGRSGHWCGYVGVTERHPAFGKPYDDVRVIVDGKETYPKVHGGLTFSDICHPKSDDHSEGICHLPEPGEPDRVWWLGFDCHHYDDRSPLDEYFAQTLPEYFWRANNGETYKALSYVKSECAELAKQLKEYGA